jgi:hypothetical protein
MQHRSLPPPQRCNRRRAVSCRNIQSKELYYSPSAAQSLDRFHCSNKLLSARTLTSVLDKIQPETDTVCPSAKSARCGQELSVHSGKLCLRWYRAPTQGFHIRNEHPVPEENFLSTRPRSGPTRRRRTALRTFEIFGKDSRAMHPRKR